MSKASSMRRYDVARKTKPVSSHFIISILLCVSCFFIVIRSPEIRAEQINRVAALQSMTQEIEDFYQSHKKECRKNIDVLSITQTTIKLGSQVRAEAETFSKLGFKVYNDEKSTGRLFIFTKIIDQQWFYRANIAIDLSYDENGFVTMIEADVYCNSM